MRFFKLEALGNDFVLVDNRDGSQPVSTRRAMALADRRRGVGCDQVLIMHAEDSEAVARIEIINADGSQAEQCGNGMRAIAAWLDSRGELNGPCALATPAGRVEVTGSERGRYRADLPAPVTITPAELDLPPPRLPDRAGRWHLLSLGNPHLVVESPDAPDEQALAALAGQLQSEPRWHNRVNIGLAHISAAGVIELRVHERGAGPTPACGSGAVAAACAVGNPGDGTSWQVHQPGGCLVIDLNPEHGRVATWGPARLVFEGNIE